jgi:hypothetical protein
MRNLNFLETKFAAAVRRRLGLTLSEQLHENRLVECSGAIGVGINQGLISSARCYGGFALL